MSAELQDLKARAIARIDGLRDELIGLARDIHAHPETAFKEHRSAGLLVDALRRHGLAVSTGTGGLETAFKAEHGTGPGPTIAVLAEYDALPGIGHGCGHNLICTAALGAGLGVSAAAADLPGRLLVLGTPAEEGGGGKVLMARAGVFEDVDAAMMFHPSSRNIVDRGSLAMVRVTVEFHGKAAHAASAPDMGINALEAMIQTFVLVNGMRQHLRRDAVLHGIITDGGKAANVVPDYTAAQFSVRATDHRYRDELVERLRACVNGAAAATGARGVVTPGMSYDDIVPNRVMSDACTANFEALGITIDRPRPGERMGSTDMGDVSQLVPSIHPYLGIASEGTGGHTADFATAAATDEAMEAMLMAARGMAMTCLDLFYRPGMLDRARAEFQEQLAAGRVRGRLA